MFPIPLKIAGMGHYVPDRVVTNDELETQMGLPPGWIEKHNGVCQRHWVTTETASFMAAQAAHEALANAGMSLNDIDLIINGSGTPEQSIPDGGALIQRQLGLEHSGVPAMTVHMTCLGFLAALKVAASFIMTGLHRNILIAVADIASCGLNVGEPASATLLGDAAAAAVITRAQDTQTSQIEAIHFETYSSGAALTEIRGGGSRRHPNHPNTQPEDNLFTMHGADLLRLAIKTLPPFFERLRPGLSQGLDGIDLVVPHQASKMGLRVLERLNYPPEKQMNILAEYGNTIAASIPLAMYFAIEQARVQRGSRVMLVGTGAGYSIGGAILTF